MTKRLILGAVMLALSLALLAPSLASGKRLNNGPGCGFQAAVINTQLVEISKEWRANKGILKPRRLSNKGGPYAYMPQDIVRQMLIKSWRAFGYRQSKAERYARANLKQIQIESSFIPNIMQSKSLHDVNRRNPAGGLFQFIPETYEAWRMPGYGDRFNPLGNILAAVNAQVNSDMKLLRGKGGWGPGWEFNPCL